MARGKPLERHEAPRNSARVVLWYELYRERTIVPYLFDNETGSVSNSARVRSDCIIISHGALAP